VAVPLARLRLLVRVRLRRRDDVKNLLFEISRLAYGPERTACSTSENVGYFLVRELSDADLRL
jgi:hypothetical protein